jgi:hypothetical protein
VARPEHEIAALYGLPLGEFTGGRDALARRLRAAGESERAAAVRGLRKPSLAAWALNTLSRLRPGELGDLLAAGEEAERAQAAALSGRGGAPELQAAQTALRRHGQRLADEAAEILVKDGHAAREEILARVRAALEATAVSEEGRDALRAGVFTAEPEPAGFGVIARLSPGRPPSPKVIPDPARDAVRAIRDEIRLLRGQRLAQERAARKASRVAAAKEREAAEARLRADEEHENAERTRAAEEDAEKRLARAEAELRRHRRRRT